MKSPQGFSRQRRQRGTGRGSFPNAGPQTRLLGWGATTHSHPRDGGACLEDLAEGRALHGGSGEPHTRDSLSRVHPGRGKHAGTGARGCSVHARQSPRGAQAAHSHAQVGTTRCPRRTAHTHHVVVLTWDGARPRSPQSGPGRPTEADAEGRPSRTGRGQRERSGWTAERRTCLGTH